MDLPVLVTDDSSRRLWVMVRSISCVDRVGEGIDMH